MKLPPKHCRNKVSNHAHRLRKMNLAIIPPVKTVMVPVKVKVDNNDSELLSTPGQIVLMKIREFKERLKANAGADIRLKKSKTGEPAY